MLIPALKVGGLCFFRLKAHQPVGVTLVALVALHYTLQFITLS